MEFDLTAGAFYVVGTLLLFGGLASGLAMAIAHFAQPGAAASAWTFVMLGGAALIVLGVSVAKTLALRRSLSGRLGTSDSDPTSLGFICGHLHLRLAVEGAENPAPVPKQVTLSFSECASRSGSNIRWLLLRPCWQAKRASGSEGIADCFSGLSC